MSSTNLSLIKSDKHKHSGGYLLNNYSYIVIYVTEITKEKEGMILRLGHGSSWKEERKKGKCCHYIIIKILFNTEV